MKNPHYEWLGRRMREYHRTHPWRLSEGGLYIPHAYWNMTETSLSYWDDVGFILNGRRIIVWWRHPRDLYWEQVKSQAWEEVGDDPQDDWLFEGGTTNYKKVGKTDDVNWCNVHSWGMASTAPKRRSTACTSMSRTGSPGNSLPS